MQESVALVRLSPVAVIPKNGIVPAYRRQELARRRKERRAAAGQTVSGAAVSSLTNCFFLAYSAGAALAWIGGAHVALAVLCSLASALFLLLSRHLIGETSKAFAEYRRLAIPPAMETEARVEAALEAAVDEWNSKALAWNEAASIAEASGVDDRYVVRLRSHRDALERRRETLVDGIAQAWVSAATTETESKSLPTPCDCGYIVPIDLKSR